VAHKKAGGSASNLKDSKGQRLGVKLYGGEHAKAGAIIVRQRGTRYFAGLNAKRSNDDSIFAIKEGFVKFKKKMKRGYDRKLKQRVEVNVMAK
jgi:large subunit ribosomal protein L27|tara:strand:+ start:3747 stop:4025 length:279 start_codon:yes stop_codon:yes gene_type:complete